MLFWKNQSKNMTEIQLGSMMTETLKTKGNQYYHSSSICLLEIMLYLPVIDRGTLEC